MHRCILAMLWLCTAVDGASPESPTAMIGHSANATAAAGGNLQLLQLVASSVARTPDHVVVCQVRPRYDTVSPVQHSGDDQFAVCLSTRLPARTINVRRSGCLQRRTSPYHR